MRRPRGYYRFAVGTAVLGAMVGAGAPAYATLTAQHPQIRAAMVPNAYAYVVAECGHCGFLVFPQPSSTFPDGGTNTMVGINTGPFMSNSILTATTAGNTPAGTASGSATVDSMTVTLNPGTVNLNGVSAMCKADPTGASGTGTITSGTVTTPGGTFDLPGGAAPNTMEDIPGFGTIVLNAQHTKPDGGLSVDAVDITKVNGQPVSLIIGHADCTGAPMVQPVPMVSAPVGAGAGAVAMGTVGGLAFLRRRHRNSDVDAV